MSRLILILLLLLAVPAASHGKLRLRLLRRFPGCRGTIEDVYAGDEWAFLQRIEFGLPSAYPNRCTPAGVLLLEKDRGEEWVDLISGGLSLESGDDSGLSLYAGWLEAVFGSGAVLSHPGAWSGSDPGSYNKPPAIRSRVRLSRSSISSDGNSLTGAGARFSVSGLSVSVVQGLSRVDGSEGGYHRTPGEIEGRGKVREVLSAVRVVYGPAGVTGAAGWESGSDTPHWQRGGVDLQLSRGAFLLSGGAAVGFTEGESSIAWWGSMTHRSDRFTHCVTAYETPEPFPLQRSSPPGGDNPSLGIRYGYRWKVFPGTTFSAGAGLVLTDPAGLTASASAEQRFGSGLEGRISFRSRGDDEEMSTRLLTACTWEPAYGFSVTARVQITGWRDSDSSQSGSALEIRLGYSPSDLVQLRTGAAAFSTDGYPSRVYTAELAFPGEFGSVTLYGRGFLLQASTRVLLREDLSLRARVAWQNREGAVHMGSGWEETDGPIRTEAGIQLDYSF